MSCATITRPLRSFAGAILLLSCLSTTAFAQETVDFSGGTGAGQGKNVVLISGDEEYRSEEALVQLARILSRHHGFRCSVLFAIDPKSGSINPHTRNNIPGLEQLEDADLMILFTRWRTLPDEQMQHIDAYLKSGRPVIGMRTSTHAFSMPNALRSRIRRHQQAQAGQDSPEALHIEADEWGSEDFGCYSDGYTGPPAEWQDGFGRLVLGEKWISHHGHHKHESTRGIIPQQVQQHPVLRGIKTGSIWGPTDVYHVRLPLPGDSTPLVLGQVVQRSGRFDADDIHYGMSPQDSTPVAEKNSPMMPVAWTKTYQLPGGKQGRVFTTTMGASVDLISAGTRRLLVNGVYWAVELEDRIPPSGTKVDIVEPFEPSQYGFRSWGWWKQRGLTPADLVSASTSP